MDLTQIEMEFSSELFSEAQGGRSPGLHLTDILTILDKAINPKNYRNDITEEELDRYGALGFMWEQILSEVWRDTAIDKSAGVLIRPPEVSRDGIAMSPDALHIVDWAIEEYKCTWKSSARDIRDFWRYWAQIKAYCHGVGTDTARLRVLFINGDYKRFVPEVKAWQARFTGQELEENWAMVVNQARAEGML